HKVPQSLSWDETVLVEPYSIGAQSLWRGSVRGKQTLLIQGAGSIGTIILRMTKSVSPETTVIMSDIMDEKLEFAQANGADYIINPSKENIEKSINDLTKKEGVNTVIDAVGTFETFEKSIQIASVAG